MALKKSSIVVNDVLEELNEENKRLLNELLFADKCLNALIEFKSFVDLVFNEFKHNFNENQLKRYQKLDENIETIFGDIIPNSIQNDSNFDQNIELRSEEEINDREEDIDYEEVVKSSETEDNQTSDDIDYNTSKELVAMTSESSSNTTSNHTISDQKKPKLSFHFDERPFLCQICGQTFKRKDLSNHMKTHANKWLIVCGENGCQFRTNNKEFLRQHMITHSEDQLLSQSISVEKEIADIKEPSNQTFVCDIDDCNKEFKFKFSFRYHQKVNHKIEKKFVCDHPNCHFETVTPQRLSHHMISHSNDRPFRCIIDGCDKWYKTNEHLKRHVIRHSNDRNFECTHEGCDKKFKTSNERNTHQICHSGKNLLCDWPGCEYTTYHKSMLNNHAMVHSQEYNHPCEWPGCDKRYKSRRNLISHMKVHKAYKKYPCYWPGCQFRATQSYAIKRHIQSIHKKDK